LIITNNFGLPEAFVRAAATGAFPPSLWRHRVSQLTGSVRMRWFELTHWDELTADASERLWAIMGTAIHNVLHAHCGDNEIAEERLRYVHRIGDREVAISGQADILTQTGPDTYKVTDWKFCKVNAMTFDKTSWFMQLRCYAWLYGLMGFRVTEAELVLILRNRDIFRAMYDTNYPQADVQTMPVDLWDSATVESWSREMSNRLVLADELAIQGAPESEVPLCSDEERWYSPSKWAVTKRKAQKASRVLLTEDDARAYLATRKNPEEYAISFRPGRSGRCHLCAARSICSQWAAQSVIEAAGANPSEEGDE